MDDLVLAPWKEIVLQGTAAVRNAGTTGDERMLKAAQGLVSEGERGLKKLGPLCQKNGDEFGTSFANDLKDNGRGKIILIAGSPPCISLVLTELSRGDIVIHRGSEQPTLRLGGLCWSGQF